MQDSIHDELLDLSRRQVLSAAQKSRLQMILVKHPELKETWEQDNLLNLTLHHLPDCPLSSNFTALVLQAVTQPQSAKRRTRAAGWLQFICWDWMRPAAATMIIMGVGLAGYNYHRQQSRWEMARSLVAIASLTELASPNLVKDFDLIQRLNQGGAGLAEGNPIDVALLADLQQ
jgi:hypothetical protein